MINIDVQHERGEIVKALKKIYELARFKNPQDAEKIRTFSITYFEVDIHKQLFHCFVHGWVEGDQCKKCKKERQLTLENGVTKDFNQYQRHLYYVRTHEVKT